LTVQVIGRAALQVRGLAKNAFHNVSYFAGTLDDLVAGLGERPVVARDR